MNHKEFEEILAHYEKIKHKYVDNRLKFYKDRVDKKRHFTEIAKLAILILSLGIPIVASLDLEGFVLSKAQIVSVMSLLIAFFTGLNELYKWQHLWQAYSNAIVHIDTLVGMWELEVAKVRQLHDPNLISGRLKEATQTLLQSVEQTVMTEMGTFFTQPSKRNDNM